MAAHRALAWRVSAGTVLLLILSKETRHVLSREPALDSSYEFLSGRMSDFHQNADVLHSAADHYSTQ